MKRCKNISDQWLECQQEDGHTGEHNALRASGVVYDDDEHEEWGDEVNVPCPGCGEEVCIQDLTTDGCLVAGQVFQCYDCGKDIIITSVDWSATVTVKLNRSDGDGKQVQGVD